METGATNHTIHLDKNGAYFPCRCGKEHRGEYACEDYLHHECLHESNLVDIEYGLVLCPDCGNTWHLESLEVK